VAAGRLGRGDGGGGRYDAGACAGRVAGCLDHDRGRLRGHHRDCHRVELHRGHHRDGVCTHLGDHLDGCLNQAAVARILVAEE